jgi:hypothetical protein
VISVDLTMELVVECTHCQVTMTSWSAPGSRVRYFQCPFCLRTHSSFYDEVFSRGAGARRVGGPSRMAEPTELPMASREQIEWATVKARAARWFARLEAEEHQTAARLMRAVVAAQPAPRAAPPAAAESPALVAARPVRRR